MVIEIGNRQQKAYLIG